MTFNVFVSYAREDSGFALQLAGDLRANGVPVWVDQWNIPPGVSWPRAIEEALTACTHFLIVLSPYSTASTEVHNELNYALSQGKHILPVLFAPCNIPYRIQSLEYIDFTRGRDRYQDAVGKLVQLFGTTTHLAPAPQRVAPPSPAPVHTAPKPRRRACTISIVLVNVIVLVGLCWSSWVSLPLVRTMLVDFLGNRCGSPQELTASTEGGPWSSGDVGGLELIVDSVELSNDAGTSTVHLTAKNNTKQAITLAAFGSFKVIDNFNSAYDPDPFRSSWSNDVPACDTVSGAIVLEEPLDPNGSPFRVTFTNVMLGGDFRDVSVKEIHVQ